MGQDAARVAGANVLPIRGIEMIQVPRAQFETQVEQLRLRLAELNGEISRMRNNAEMYRVMANSKEDMAHGFNVGSYVTSCEDAERLASRVRTLRLTTENVARWLQPRATFE